MSKSKLFLKYYKEYKDKVYNYFLYRLSFNKSLAEDLSSEVFLRAFDKFESFEEDRSFQAWVYAIARNCLYNYYRTCNREVELDQALNLYVEDYGEIANNLESERILKKIKKLDIYNREVLLLRYVDELSNGEIAEVLNKNEGAIRTQISRALKILKENLE